MPSNSINQLLINTQTPHHRVKQKDKKASERFSESLSLTSRSDSFDLMIRVKDPFYGMESLFLFHFILFSSLYGNYK
jgi:hypothetical protein